MRATSIRIWHINDRCTTVPCAAIGDHSWVMGCHDPRPNLNDPCGYRGLSHSHPCFKGDWEYHGLGDSELGWILEAKNRETTGVLIHRVGDSLAHTKLTQLRTQDSDSLARTKVSQLYTQSLRGMGWGSLTSLSFLLSSWHRHCSFMISYRWGGVGWGNNVHVPVHTQAQQPYHLSCCPVDTSPSSSSSSTTSLSFGQHHHHHHHHHHRHHHHKDTSIRVQLVSCVHNRVGFRVHNRGPNRSIAKSLKRCSPREIWGCQRNEQCNLGEAYHVYFYVPLLA